jgi:probable rRNA maturation factor
MPVPKGEPRPLGDIVLAYGVIAREAAAQGKTLHDHTAHLIVHGVLHLLGFDHETGADAEDMERLETSILKGLGVSNPYE